MGALYQCSLRLKYSEGYVGYPHVVARGQHQVIVCDWTGTIYLIDLSLKSIPKSVNVAWEYQGHPMGGLTLSSLQIQPMTGDSCVVATRGAYAALWNLETSEVIKIHLDSGLVNAVAYSPDGTSLAIGTGCYALTSNRVSRPTLQIWDLSESEPNCIMSTTLPGACIDYMLWDARNNRILCVTGNASQKTGHLCCLEEYSFKSYCFDVVPFAMASKIIMTDELYVISHRNGINAYDRKDFQLQWSYAESVNIADLAIDDETEIMFFSGGTFLSTDGEVIGEAELLDTLSSINPRPNGGFIGVSNQGIITAWDYNENFDYYEL